MTRVEISKLIELIKETVDSNEMNRGKLAEISGFSEGYISQILNLSRGHRTPNAGPVLVIGRAIGMVNGVTLDPSTPLTKMV